ncbi:MAG: hypothetical protein HQL77_14525 [Magnetococcales bacterium]|nr:hypothetical protein [Magnetococcales bacterium]
MDVHAIVERLVQERGQLDPLVFLQEIGAVSKPGLTSWRHGDVSCLQEVLQGDPQWIDGCLRQAGRMARTLGLAPKTVDSCRMDADGHHRGLRIDNIGDPGREALYTTHYQRPRSDTGGIQLDLFLDTPETMLVNDLIQAVAQHDDKKAAKLCKQLEKEHPNNGVLEEVRPLIAAIKLGEKLVASPIKGLKRLREEIIPCAKQALGNLERHFLKPFYRQFDQVLIGQTFDPKHPDAHRSWTLECLENWQSLAECILLEEAWTQHPLLLYRRAHALFQGKRLVASWQVWVQFFWGFPLQAASALENAADKELKRLWLGFSDHKPDIEPDPTLFPAWMLLAQPLLTENRDEWLEEIEEKPSHTGRTVFFLLDDLLRAEKSAPASSGALSLRRQLKETSPEAFALFLQTVQQSGHNGSQS